MLGTPGKINGGYAHHDDEVRCSKFDEVMSRIRVAWEAGIAPPRELLLEAVAVRVKSAAKRARDFTFPTLGLVKFLAGGTGTWTHSLSVDLPYSGWLNVRGFFGPLGALGVRPSIRGGPVQDDAVAEDASPGRIVIAGVCPCPAVHYLLFSVGYVNVTDEKGFYERAITVNREVISTSVEEFISLAPEVTSMFLFRLVSDGFGTIAHRHQRLAEEATRIARAMGNQDANLARLLEQTPPQSR